MKQVLRVLILTAVLFGYNISAAPESSEADSGNGKLPATPGELLKFLTGTSWRLQSENEQYFGEGTVVLLEKGLAEHIYKDGAIHKKHWGVTNDMKMIWGGKFMQVCRFSSDFKTFVGSRNQTTGRQMVRREAPEPKVSTKK